ncbi:hypothetical protein [Cellulophaga baltica]|uniref:hypothetical protein n=1 Tax=Cellulophaga baltica TaxID=76594 RepID=UPI002495920E|nr:hypothetical protein [Cellulophaga baltica]
MNSYTNIIPYEKFNLAIPHPDYKDVNDFLKKAESEDINLIQEIMESNLLTGKNIVIFENAKSRIGVLGRGFSGLSMADNNLVSLSFFDSDLNNKVNLIKILNMHPAKGSGYGTISFSNDNTDKAMIIFFIDSNYKKWDEDFKKSDSSINVIQKFLKVDNVQTDKAYNC